MYFSDSAGLDRLSPNPWGAVEKISNGRNLADWQTVTTGRVF
ncbi:MAG: hypothetical protein O2860_01575 [Chloroflexi bacterium]|nr:hypothetical protein [Chloroflexota bacterium]